MSTHITSLRSIKLVKLCVQLSGGLGNQMFQFAVGRALALDRKVDFAIDAWSGFVRDTQYRRSYALGKLPIDTQFVTPCDQIALWMYRLMNRESNNPRTLQQRRWYGDVYIENAFRYHSELYQAQFTRLTWLIGYWQTPLYFKRHRELLQKELMPPTPINPKFTSMAMQIKDTESVALGVRLYEESTNPADHAGNSSMKTATEVTQTINHLRTVRPNAQFYVFCTHRSKFLDELGLPPGTTFVTADDGFEDAVDCMWLLSRCKHHIFTNSTYYWWGAWLSEAVHKQEEQLIFAADNFINIDGLCDHWKRF